jgi:hypothetical protein
MAGIHSIFQWRYLLGVVVLVVALVGWVAWRGFHPEGPRPTEDPRLTFDSPYRNVRPEVKYVGSEMCANCHPAHAATYRQHPMGRSLAPVLKAGALERFDPESHNPFGASGFQFLIEWRNGKLVHKEARQDPRGQLKTEFEAEVHYVIGSGARARSYLIEHEGYLFQSAITWYSQKGIWDLSPGFAANPHSDRPITAECLFCHCNHADPIEHTINRYRLPIFQGFAIGCERCHGPGELHVQRRERGEPIAGEDHTIVNPGRLAPPLREAVCQQCHLQGEMRILHRGRRSFDYRPGLPWHLFWSVLVKPPDESNGHRAVGQVEQMQASRCYQAGGKLGCISCHDPHALPEPPTKAAYYRRRCLNCHTEASCKRSPGAREERARNQDCIACHMPRLLSSDVAHTAITDHRILRTPADHRRKAGVMLSPPTTGSIQDPGSLGGESMPPPVSDFPLGAFPSDRFDLEDPDFSRDFGLALTKLAESGTYDRPARIRLTGDALRWLDAAVKTSPQDAPAWQARGYALWQQNRKEEAQAAFQTALALAPEREATLSYAASLAAEMGQHDSAVAYWQRALAVNPWAARGHFELARLLILSQEWQKAGEEANVVLRLNPFHIEARKLLVVCYHQMGDKARARTEFERILGLNPPDLQALRRWFDQLTR